MTNKEFLQNNSEQLIELGRLIRQIDTVRGIDRIQDVKGRQQAIRIINEWLNKLWEVDVQDIVPPEDDELFRSK
jgi:hypothetical protein